MVAIRGLEIPRSHDVVLLLRLLAPEQSMPDAVRDAGWLNPWAITMRYDQAGGALDGKLAVRVAGICVSWGQELVEAARAESD